MPRASSAISPISWTRFGDLLKYLRRRARMTQRELAIEVGYSEVHISRLEGTHRPPDDQTLLALFVPALDLQHEPELATRLLELAAAAREPLSHADSAPLRQPTTADLLGNLEAIPLPPTCEVPRLGALQPLRQQLANERVVAVCAMAGMGKTALMAALAREEARTRPVFWLTLTAGVTTSVEAIIRQLAWFLLAQGQKQALPLVQRRDNASRTFTLDEQIALIGAALTRLAWKLIGTRAAPYGGLPLLCFDNVHLVQDDAGIVQVLRHLVAATPAALLLASREQVPLPGIASVSLQGLERTEGLALIAQLSAELAPMLAVRLLDKTGGNPMLLRLALGQLLQAAEPASVIAHLEQEPHVVAYLLDTALRQLPPPAAKLLAFVSVFRQPINLYDPALRELIQSTDDSADLTSALSELQRRYLIDHPTQAAIHPLLRDHSYATLAADGPRKRRLHELAAAWSERVMSDLVEATHHYAAAGNVDRAGELLTEQGHLLIEQGRAFAAVEVIDELLRQVRWRGAASDLTRQLLTLRADLLVGTLRAAEAESNYRAALQQAVQPTIRAQIAARLVESLAQRGQAEEALHVSREARTALAETHPMLLVQLVTAESHAHLVLTSYEAALQTANDGLLHVEPFARQAPQVTAEIRVKAHQIIATVMRARQQFDEAATHLQHAITAAQQGNLAHLARRCQIDMVSVYFAQGDLEGAIAMCDAMLPQLHAANDSYAMARLLSMTSMNYLMHGDVTTALQTVERACEIAEDIGDTHCLADSRLRRSRILIAAGRILEARSIIERLLITSAATGEMQLQGYVLDRLAVVQLLNGDAVAAMETFQRAFALPAATTDGKLRSDLHNHLAFSLVLTGTYAQAQRLLADEPSLRLPTSTVLTRQLIHAMLLWVRGDAVGHVVSMGAAITAQADATRHYLFSRAAKRLIAATTDPPPGMALPGLLWVDLS